MPALKLVLLLAAITFIGSVAAAYRPVPTGLEAPHYFRRLVDKSPLTFNPNPRLVSNTLAALQLVQPKSAFNFSLWEVFVGQAIFTHDGMKQLQNSTVMNIPLLPGDPFYNASATNNYIAMNGTVGAYFLNEDGELRFHVRNHNTDASDLSILYGSDTATLQVLRAGTGGRLKTQDYFGFNFRGGPFPWVNSSILFRNFPPSQASTGLPVATALTENTQARRFTSGDDRLNENIVHTLVTTLWLRNHNNWAETKAVDLNETDDNLLLEEARKMNIAQEQQIEHYEYAPKILGSLAILLKEYDGYDPEVDPRITDAYALAIQRYGHSNVKKFTLRRRDNSIYNFSIPRLVPGPEMAFAGQLGGPQLPDLMFLLSDNATEGKTDGVNNILRGVARNRADANDLFFSDTVRNINFPGIAGRVIDLFAVDIHRGFVSELSAYLDYRTKVYNDHPLPKGENSIYKAPGCDASKHSAAPDPLGCYLIINSNETIATVIRELYPKINQIPLMVGMLFEEAYPGSQFSRTAGAIIARQYNDRRAGDPFFFEREGVLTSEELEIVRNTTLASLVRLNFNLTAEDIQDDIFVVPSEYILE